MARKGEFRASPRLPRDPSEGPLGLVDEAEITDAILSGDYSGLDVTLAEIVGCRLDRAQFTGSRLDRSRLVDCLVIDSDFSGAFFEECRLTRVEFRGGDALRGVTIGSDQIISTALAVFGSLNILVNDDELK